MKVHLLIPAPAPASTYLSLACPTLSPYLLRKASIYTNLTLPPPRPPPLLPLQGLDLRPHPQAAVAQRRRREGARVQPDRQHVPPQPLLLLGARPPRPHPAAHPALLRSGRCRFHPNTTALAYTAASICRRVGALTAVHFRTMSSAPSGTLHPSKQLVAATFTTILATRSDFALPSQRPECCWCSYYSRLYRHNTACQSSRLSVLLRAARRTSPRASLRALQSATPASTRLRCTRRSSLPSCRWWRC